MPAVRILFAVLLLASFLPATARAGACDINRSSLNCASAPVTTSVDWSFWDGIGIGQLFEAERYDSCGVGTDYDNEQDVWLYTCAASGPVQFLLYNQECNMDLFVLNGGCSGSQNCAYSSTQGGRSNDQVFFDCVAGEIYYIVIERKDENFWFWEDCTRWESFQYSFRVRCIEVCNDRYDNDADGLVDCLDPDCPFCVEECEDNIDNDFDGLIDCDDPDCLSEPACCDKDLDGFLAAGGSCGGDDCNDTPGPVGRGINPGAVEEVADGIDSNCDGFELCYTDNDGDFYGISIVVDSRVFSCLGQGVAAVDGDCDDSNPDIHPDQPEIPVNGQDDNCDNLEDCYLDGDNDSYGSSTVVPTSVILCNGGDYADNNDDCNDADPNTYPGALDLPNTNRDEDCDGLETCFADRDGDGFGNPMDLVVTPFIDCMGPGVSSNALDCNDVLGVGSTIFPGAVEGIADGVDQNCDGFEVCYRDADEDDFGNEQGITNQSTDLTCRAGTVAPNDQDCNDQDPTIYPGAPDPEGDAVDQDCDGLQECYVDADGDGYGSDVLTPSAAVGCIGLGIAPRSGDCDDTNPTINPGAQEGLNDGIDQNCDLLENCYADNDGDGIGGDQFRTSNALDCIGAGVSPTTGDCNDLPPFGASIYPGAVEVPNSGFDENCDGFESCFLDADTDGYGRPGVYVNSRAMDCNVLGVAPNDQDCDDSNFRRNPGATERPADNLDANCDNLEDCYRDNDGDDYGVPIIVSSPDITCNASGVANNDDDCNDNAADVYPGAPPGPLPGVDYSCSGFITCFQDFDRDGYGDPNVTVGSADPLCAQIGLARNGDDCNDNDRNIHPGAVETVADLTDSDCDGFETCYQDLDGDLFGTVNLQPSTDLTCNSAGVSQNDDDCNDNPAANGASIYPGAPELPASGVSEDCDPFEICYQDIDGDGYGRPATIPSTILTCTGPGIAPNDDDCVDTLPGGAAINPGANDIPANSIDENCDLRDLCYEDQDGDSFGRPNSLIPGPLRVGGGSLTCSAPGVSDNGNDCNDVPPGGASVYPGATEIPGNGIDENCDNNESCYVDNDGDGYGQTGVLRNSTALRCQQPGLSAEGGDCNDLEAAINPGAQEIPADGVDQDCDLNEDCYRDEDRDRYGTTVIVESRVFTCFADGVADNPDDCFDLPPQGRTVHPNAPEIVGNGIDDNCDGNEVCFRDFDGDGFGVPQTGLSPTVDCTAPGFSPTADDCNDTLPGGALIYPGAQEVVADTIDQNCDMMETCYVDRDLDTYGSSATQNSSDLSCRSLGVSNNDDDCNDVPPGGAFVNPGATEIPGDGVDQNCDGAESCYLDADGDGFGGTNTTLAASFDCNAPNATRIGGDCNDGNPLIYPGAPEIVADGIDQDCDTVDSCYQDLDRDGFGSSVIIDGNDLICQGNGEASNRLDCLDVGSIDAGFGPVASVDINPNADEACNGVDDDCDTLIDDADPDVVATTYWYPDVDMDGFGATNLSVPACDVPGPGYTAQSGDCNDNNPFVNPDEDEICDPLNVDEDCNGLADDLDIDPVTRTSVAIGAQTVYPDADGDQYGNSNPSLGISTCDVPAGYINNRQDCLDSNPNVNPGMREVPYNGLDDDCDPSTPDDDLDGDGFGHLDDCNDNPLTGASVNPAASEGTIGNGRDDDCDGVVDNGTNWGDDDGDGYSEVGGDCDDANPNIHPGFPEQPNSIDDDCDGAFDEGTIRSDDDGDGWTENQSDCNDGDPNVHPGNVEDCPGPGPECSDGIDNDCDGRVDGGTFDPDGDGYTEAGGDCDDTNANRYPGAPELPNGLDDDCDTIIDEGTNNYDDDGDGYTETEGDCNDTPVTGANVNPGQAEQQNGIDDNCDGRIDEQTLTSDDDGDGFSEVQGDCDDTNPNVNPAAPEVPNGIDDNCLDGIDEGLTDLDDDGFTTEDGDCDDDNGWVHPGAAEVCDLLDNDCDGLVDGTATVEDVCDDTVKVDVQPGCQDGCSSSGRGGPMGLSLLVLAFGLRRRRAAAA